MTAYCPGCGREITPEAVEYGTLNVIWSKCKGFCPMALSELVTDPQGFVISPSGYIDRYVHTRPNGRSAEQGRVVLASRKKKDD